MAPQATSKCCEASTKVLYFHCTDFVPTSKRSTREPLLTLLGVLGPNSAMLQLPGGDFNAVDPCLAALTQFASIPSATNSRCAARFDVDSVSMYCRMQFIPQKKSIVRDMDHINGS